MKLTLAMFCLLIGQAVAQDQSQTIQMSVSPEQLRAMIEEATVAPDVKGNIILRDGRTVTAEGEVQVRTREVIVHADRVVVDTKTGEIQASGKVRIIPVAPPPKLVDVLRQRQEEFQRRQ